MAAKVNGNPHSAPVRWVACLYSVPWLLRETLVLPGAGAGGGLLWGGGVAWPGVNGPCPPQWSSRLSDPGLGQHLPGVAAAHTAGSK